MPRGGAAGNPLRRPRRVGLLRPRRVGLGRRLRTDGALVLMTLPALCLLLVLHYLPLVGSVIAFQDYSPYAAPGLASFWSSPWVGLDNLRQLVDDPGFWHALSNTLLLTGLGLLLFFPVPIILALALDTWRHQWARAIVQSLLYLPHFLSWVVVIAIFDRFWGPLGLVTDTLSAQGLHLPAITTDPRWFPLLATAQSIWKDAGWGIVVFLAALAGVSGELHEAAAADGAGAARRLWHVTLPALRPTVVLVLILRLGDALNVGFEQFLLQRGAVGAGASEVLDTYTYFTGIQDGAFSLAAAAGLLKGLVGLLLVLGANRAAHLLGEDGVYRGDH